MSEGIEYLLTQPRDGNARWLDEIDEFPLVEFDRLYDYRGYGDYTLAAQFLEQEIEGMDLRTYHLPLERETERHFHYLERNKVRYVLLPTPQGMPLYTTRLGEIARGLEARGGEAVATRRRPLDVLDPSPLGRCSGELTPWPRPPTGCARSCRHRSSTERSRASWARRGASGAWWRRASVSSRAGACSISPADRGTSSTISPRTSRANAGGLPGPRSGALRPDRRCGPTRPFAPALQPPPDGVLVSRRYTRRGTRP